MYKTFIVLFSLMHLSNVLPEVDPYQNLNEKTHNFNQSLDESIATPIARIYKKITPDFIEIGDFNIAVHKPDRIININTYQDHRMAMSFAVLGTRIGNLNIKNPEVVGKTYPQFWNDLARLT